MKTKILIVEDEVNIKIILKRRLEEEGFSVLEAENGEDGLNMAKNKHPDLILIDILLPRMDGITMLEKIREDAWGKNARAMFLTNIDTDEEVSRAQKLEPLGYLIKTDWILADVVKQIKDNLKKK